LTGENKDVYRKKRASNAYHLLVPLFSNFTGSVLCHTLPFFGKSPFGIISISFDFLYDFVTLALPLLSFPVLSAFTLISSAQSAIFEAMPRAPVLATIHGCVTNFIAFLYKA